MKIASFSILISTKNRKEDLAFTLGKINNLLLHESVEVVVFDDGSTDGTFEFVKQNYPNVIVHRNAIFIYTKLFYKFIST